MYLPTVIEGLAYNCRVNMEEVFGPVVTLTPFETEEEVIKFANATEYGLSATIWTENLTRAHRVVRTVGKWDSLDQLLVRTGFKDTIWRN